MQAKPLIGITMEKEGGLLKIKHSYSEAIRKTGGIPVFLPPDQNTSDYATLIDGLLIPGGNDLDPWYYGESALPQVNIVPRERSDFEFALVGSVMEFRKPILGICYGMQLLDVFFGGTLYQDIAIQTEIAINHKTGYHMIVITENRFVEQGTFSVNSTHHQGIKSIGNGLSSFVFSHDNLVEAFYKEDYPFLVGVQWHPECDMGNDISMHLFSKFIEASR